jgi:hypothetical protein
MKTEAGYELQTYEPSGQELRIHWNVEQKTKEVMDDETVTYWEADEALCKVTDDRPTLIEKIIGSVYTTGAELAVINNKDIDPSAYAEYQNFRVQAKQLADGWLNKE